MVLGEWDVKIDPDQLGNRKSPSLAAKVTRHPAKIQVHPLFGNDSSNLSSYLSYDISLVRLDHKIDDFFTGDSMVSTITPVCLPWKSNMPGRRLKHKETKLTVMGWGATTNDEEFNSKQLEKIGARTDRPKALEMPFVGMPTCSKEYNSKYGNWSLIGSFQWSMLKLSKGLNSSIHLCAGGDLDQDSCQGDSGSPLSYKEQNSDDNSPWYQVGIVSYGTPECAIGLPGVYTNVVQLIPWIYNAMDP